MKGEKASCRYCKQEFIKKNRLQVYCQYNCNYNHAMEKQRNAIISNQFAVFQRDDFRCMYCGKSSIEDDARLVLDHVIPAAKGGGNEHTNLVTCCTECNGAKNSYMLSPEVLKRIATKIEFKK